MDYDKELTERFNKLKMREKKCSSTVLRRYSDTCGWSFITLETLACEQPAARATSEAVILGGLGICGSDVFATKLTFI